MTILKLERDAYGTYARHSAIADFLELAALAGTKIRQADVARVFERDGLDLEPSVFERLVPGEDEADKYKHMARRVFDILEERARILRERYPLQLSGGSLTRRRRTRVGLYVALLSMTTAHSHNLNTPHNPRRVFEQIVARCLERSGLRTATMGTSVAGAFSVRLDAACAAVGLQAAPGAVIVSSAAQDEKVDTLVHLDLGCGRRGRWLAVGQATVGSSNSWVEKITEISTREWRLLTGDWLQPSAFLAVPHHVDRFHWDKLLQDHGRLIFDRLRLTISGESPARAELDIVDAVRACTVEW